MWPGGAASGNPGRGEGRSCCTVLSSGSNDRAKQRGAKGAARLALYGQSQGWWPLTAIAKLGQSPFRYTDRLGERGKSQRVRALKICCKRHHGSTFSQSKQHLQALSLAVRNDRCPGQWYVWGMAAIRHDWYFREWLKYAGKRQTDVVKDLDWNKAKVSLMIRGEQQYTRDAVNEVAAYLNIAPFELLMHPDEAAALKRLRSTALQAIEAGRVFDRAEDELGDGTNG